MPNKILTRIYLPKAAGTIVLYDWMEIDSPDCANLVKMGRNDEIEWKAMPPERPPDCFTSVAIVGVALTAHSWSGYRVIVDIHTGKIVEAVFTK
jgi:hypothetical protein